MKKLLLILIIVLTVSGCTKTNQPMNAKQKPLIRDMSQGPVTLIIKADPATVSLDRDILLTISIKTPTEVDVELPSIVDRLEGFTYNGDYGSEPSVVNGFKISEKHIRLTPVIADEYRLAPMAITFSDRSRNPAISSWFATKPIVFQRKEPYNKPVGDDIYDFMEPTWIHPAAKTIGLYGLAALGVIIFIIAAIVVISKIRREARLRQMSPRDRAMLELKQLLMKHLIQNNLVKDFYVELTMIVRRYIERSHSVRAPEQTTEEFLLAISQNNLFSKDVLVTLKSFLEAADLVKFAAYQPTNNAVDQAIDTAKHYIKTDSAEGGSE